jgi:hypothetical protein
MLLLFQRNPKLTLEIVGPRCVQVPMRMEVLYEHVSALRKLLG